MRVKYSKRGNGPSLKSIATLTKKGNVMSITHSTSVMNLCGCNKFSAITISYPFVIIMVCIIKVCVLMHHQLQGSIASKVLIVESQLNNIEMPFAKRSFNLF